MPEINTKIKVRRFKTNEDNDIIVFADSFQNMLKISKADNFELYRVASYACKQSNNNILSRSEIVDAIEYFKSYDCSREDWYNKEINISSLIEDNRNIAIRNFEYLDDYYNTDKNYFEIFKFSSNKDFSEASVKLAPNVYFKILNCYMNEDYLNVFLGVIQLTNDDISSCKDRVIANSIEYNARRSSDCDIIINSEVRQEIIKSI